MNGLTLGNISFGPSLRDFDKFFIGFDKQFDRMSELHSNFAKNTANYPPYNIKKVADDKYVIELAVAGFTKSEIEVTLDGDKLTIKGSARSDPTSYLFQGIGLRDFTRTFALNDQVEVRGAGMFNGLLRIALERIIPENKKARTIEISDEPSTVSEFVTSNPKQLLTEDVERMLDPT